MNEIWTMRNGVYALYTEDRAVVKEMNKLGYHSTTYYKGKKELGWQFSFPAKNYNHVADLASLPRKKVKGSEEIT